MNSVNAYLESHYCTAEQLAAVCSMSTSDLETLIQQGLVPEPSYIVTEEGHLLSQAFGDLGVQHAKPGRYHHPRTATWVQAALTSVAEVGIEHAADALKAVFTAQFAQALAILNASVYRLADSFDEINIARADGIQRRTETAWQHFRNGVFGLCVADPSTVLNIARKEVLQEALTVFSQVGFSAQFASHTPAQILGLIDQYADAAMPFSPPEYPRSSRKRLVEDLRANPLLT